MGEPGRPSKAGENVRKIIEELENRFIRWAEEKGYESVEDLRKDLHIRDNTVYEEVNYIELIAKLPGVSLASAKNSGIGYILEYKIDSAEYIRRKGKLRIDVFQFLNNRVF